jgi:hypothetical protein
MLYKKTQLYLLDFYTIYDSIKHELSQREINNIEDDIKNCNFDRLSVVKNVLINIVCIAKMSVYKGYYEL